MVKKALGLIFFGIAFTAATLLAFSVALGLATGGQPLDALLLAAAILLL